VPTFTANNAAVSAKASELVSSALTELNVVGQGETALAGDSSWALEKLQRLIDRVNAREAMIYNVNFNLFTLIANHAPHTIGPGGNFQMAQRPVKVVSGAVVITSGGSPIDIPMAVRDDDWWAAQKVKSLTSTFPTSVYYSPDTPLGSLNFWPIATQQNQVRLETWVNLTQAVDLTTALAMPPAYWDYMVLTLARDISSSYGPPAVAVVSGPAFMAAHREATKAVQGNNQESPRMSTAEAGQTSRRGKRADFNWMTGQRS
jgi:hypothetical protein